jgi:transcription termination/antitermination factor nusG
MSSEPTKESRGKEEALVLGWYVLRVISGHEKRVCQYLENEVARLHYEELIPRVLVPVEYVVQQRNGKRIKKEKVLYSGYVFVEALMEKEVVHLLRNAPDVLGFLTMERRREGMEEKPAALQEAEVKRMLHNVDEIGDDEVTLVPYKVGDVVKVIDGPFNTCIGTVTSVDETRHRLQVEVRIFERLMPLELSYSQVDKEK